MSEAEVKRLFGAALAAQPPAPAHFTLYFQFDSDELTDESRKLVSEVQQAVKTYPAPQVTVIGHTDTDRNGRRPTSDSGCGEPTSSECASSRPGLDGSAINVTSHGEATLLVPTADDVSEPKNRRVDITVR